MRTRLHLEIDGRPVRMKRVKELPRRRRSDGREKSLLNKKIYKFMLEKMFDGKWYSLTMTKGTEAEVDKVFRQMRKRRYNDGWDAKQLKIIPTKRDGLCFCWPWVPEDIRERVVKVAKMKKEFRLAKTVAGIYHTREQKKKPPEV